MTFRERLFYLGTLDALIVSIAVLMVFLLRFDFAIPEEYLSVIPPVIAMHVLFTLAAFYGMKLYRRVLQYASVEELMAIVFATTIAVAACFLLNRLITSQVPDYVVPRSIYSSWALIILGVGGSRFAWRLFRDNYLYRSEGIEGRNVLIIGAEQAGVLVARELRYAKRAPFLPKAFIDDNPKSHGLQVLGLPVVGGRESIQRAVKQHNIQDIVIALPHAAKADIARIIDICKTTKANVKILPSLTDVMKGKVSVEMIRDVQVEDLLGREPVNLDISRIAGYVSKQVVLVTGAGGSIGSELCRQILPFLPKTLLLLGHGENSIYEIELELRKSFPQAHVIPVIADIQDRSRIEEVFDSYRPSVVFHAAAHKHVPLMEDNPWEAVKNNILGTKNVAELSSEYLATHFVMVSTDKAVNPTSIMGATKRIAEMLVQGMNSNSVTKYVTVRFGNVLGSRGSVIPIFKKQIQQGGPVTVTHPDMVRFFMTIPEAVQLVIQAGSLAKGGEIFILDMGKPVKIANLARDLISLSGLEPEVDIPIVYTGIRRGEKLYEELLTQQEGISATRHDRIFITKPVSFSWEEIHAFVTRLEQMAKEDISVKAEHAKEILADVLPEYRMQMKQSKTPVLS